MADYTHQTARDYADARRRGDSETTARIVAEVTARYDTRTTDGSELGEVLDANLTVPLAE